MCIIIHATDKNLIEKESLQQCSEHHSDGIGVMFYDKEGELHVNKSADSRHYKAIIETIPDGVECGIHFRWKTHGSVNVKNTHPFKLSKDIAFMHNGTISGYGTGKKSDTRDFAGNLRDCLRYDTDGEGLKYVKEWLEFESESWNKFLLAHDGGFLRFGKWDTVKENIAFSSDPYPLSGYSRYYSGHYRYGSGLIQVDAQNNWEDNDNDFANPDGTFKMPWKRSGLSAAQWCRKYPDMAALLLQEIESTHFIDAEDMDGFINYFDYYEAQEEIYHMRLAKENS